MKTHIWVLAAIVVAFSAARFLVPVVPLDLTTTGLYKDAAHLLAGGLFGAWGMALCLTRLLKVYISGKESLETPMHELYELMQVCRAFVIAGRWVLALAVGITVVEITAFLIR